MRRNRSLKTLQKIKLENLVSRILVPSGNLTNKRIFNEWIKIGQANKSKLVEFIFNHPINFLDHNNHYDYIPIPQYLLALLQPSIQPFIESLKIHKVFTVKHINKFCSTISGNAYKKRKIRISDIEFKLHLYPNGITEINNGFVQFCIELTKLPNNVKSIIVYINLYCNETLTKYKQTKLFEEIGDSEGWIWSLSTQQLNQYNILHFEADIKILQIKYNTNKMIDYSHTFPLDKLTVFKWNWNEIKNILNAIKSSYNNMIFFSENSVNNMYCFGIEYTRDHEFYVFCNLLKLPLDIEEIIVLFKFQMGYPSYPNTYRLSYNNNQCKLILIKHDIKWLLTREHNDLPFIFSVEIKDIRMKKYIIKNNITQKRKKIKQNNTNLKQIQINDNKIEFMSCWCDINIGLNKYYKYNNKELNNKFLQYIFKMEYNKCLITYIIGNDMNDINNWRWELLYFDHEFPIPNDINFENITQKERFIIWIFKYCYHNKNRPKMKKMKQMIKLIKENDYKYKQLMNSTQKCIDIKKENKNANDKVINNVKITNIITEKRKEMEKKTNLKQIQINNIDNQINGNDILMDDINESNVEKRDKELIECEYEYNNMIQNINKEYNNEMKCIEDDYKQERLYINKIDNPLLLWEKYKKEMIDKYITNEYEQELKSEKEKCEQNMGVIRMEYENTVKEIKEKAKTQINIVANSNKELKESILSTNEQDKNIKNDYQNKLKDGKNCFDQIINGCNKEYTNGQLYINKIINERIANDELLINEYTKELKEIQNEYKRELKLIKDTYVNEILLIKQMDKKLKKNNKQAKQLYKNELKKAAKLHNNEMKEIKKEYKQEILHINNLQSIIKNHNELYINNINELTATNRTFVETCITQLTFILITIFVLLLAYFLWY